MEYGEDIWSSIMDILKNSVPTTALNTWFVDCRIVSMENDQFILYASSQLRKDVIEERFTGMIKDALRELFASEFDVKIFSDADMERYNRPVVDRAIDNDNYTFEKFVVGNSNKFAHAAAKAVAEGRTTDYNPLFIHGDSGLGKTHLLYAIRHEIRRQHPEYNIVYVKGDAFTNELIQCLQAGRMADFHEKYRSADLFLMDDVQFIAGKESTQEEMFHTFNTLHDAGHQIVFTADRPPKEMLRLDDRLMTRFQAGLVAKIESPDYETRMAIIKNKAIQLGISLPEDVMDYIATNMTSNVRQLEGTVKKAKAYAEMMKTEITVSVMAKIMKDMVQDKSSPTPESIIEETAKYFDLSPEDLKSRSQKKGIALPRQIAMYEMRTIIPLTQQQVADVFGKDHTTVISALNKIEKMLASSDEFAKTIRDITANINGRT